MGKQLGAEAVRQYNRDGYYFPVAVLSPEEAAHYRRWRAHSLVHEPICWSAPANR